MTTKPKTLAACTVMLAGALAGCGAPREALKMHVSYHRANTAGSVVLGSPGSGDFGFSLASSGNTMLVGDDLGGADQAGVVYVYSKHRDGWVHTGSLLPPGQGIAAAGDRFGYSVAVSGNTAVVGAQSSGGGGDGQGQAFVFQHEDGTWKRVAMLSAPDGAANDGFGTAVALSAGTAVVGAPGHEAGAVYVFRPEAGTWSEVAELHPGKNVFTAGFGTSLSLLGNLLAVGAPTYNNDEGAVFAFSRLAGAGGASGGGAGAHWAPIGMVVANTQDELNGLFGTSVAVSPTRLQRLAVGAPQAGYDQTGRVYLMERQGKRWALSAELQGDDQPDSFGTTVAFAGPGTVVVGAPAHYGPGQTFVFRATGEKRWQGSEIVGSEQTNQLGAFDQFGSALAVTDGVLATSAPEIDPSGKVFLYPLR